MSELRGVARCVVLLAFAGWLCSAPPAARADAWPQWRKDSQRTGLIEMPIAIGEPGTRWRHSAGSAPGNRLVADLDGDNVADVLSVAGGRLVARRTDGTLLWDTAPLGVRRVVAVEDVGGDSAVELIVDATSSVLVLDPTTGETLWASGADLPIENLGAVEVTDLDGKPPAELFFSDRAANASKPHLTGQIFVAAFEQGFDLDAPQVATALNTRDYEAGYAAVAADMDGDGRKELVATGAQAVYAYDSETGALARASADLGDWIGPEYLAQCSLAAGDVDGDGDDEVFVFTDEVFVGVPSRRIVALDAVGDGLSVLWTWSCPNPATDALNRADPPLGQVMGGGGYHVVWSWWTPEGKWVTEVADASTGELQASLPGVRTAALVDPEGDGRAELLAAQTDFRAPSPFAHKWLYSFGGGPVPAKVSLGPVIAIAGPFPAAFAPGQPGEVIALADQDGDGWGDVLSVLAYPTGVPLASQPLGASATGVSVAKVGAGPAVLVYFAAGPVGMLSPNLSLLNDADGDGEPDLRLSDYPLTRVAATAAGGTQWVVAPEGGGIVRALAANVVSPEGEPTTAALAEANIDQTAVVVRAAGGVTALLVVFRDSERRLFAKVVESAGDVVWELEIGGPGGAVAMAKDPLVADVDGDGADEVFFVVTDAGAGQVHRVVGVNGVLGAVWQSDDLPTPGGGAGDLSASLDATRLFLVANATVFALDAASGATLDTRQNPKNHYYGMPIEADIDGDGLLELLLVGTAKGAMAWNDDGTVLWTHEFGNASRAAGAVVETPQGQLLLAAFQAGPELVVLDAATGAMLDRFGLFGGVRFDSAGSWPVGADKAWVREVLPAAAVEGGPGWIATAADGWVYALDASGAVLWALDVGGDAGSPAALDVDGDGEAELAIPSRAGELVLVDTSIAAATAWVRENACEGAALDASADIDVQESASRLCVNWAPSDGADSYVLTVVSEFGSIVLASPVTTEATGAEVQGLALQLGVRYSAVVRVLAGGVLSTPTESDGVLVEDASPPAITAFSAVPHVLAPDGAAPQFHTVALAGTASDATRLASWTLVVSPAEASSSPVLRGWSSQGVLGETVALAEVWDGNGDDEAPLSTGEYLVRWTVTDLKGNFDTAAAPVLLCRAPLRYDADKDACAPETEPPVDEGDASADAGSGDASTEADAVEAEGGTAAEGGAADGLADAGAEPDSSGSGQSATDAKDVGCGGCSSSVRDNGASIGLWGMVAAWWWRRRRS